MAHAWGPLRRTIPTPPWPGGVATAAMVSSEPSILPEAGFGLFAGGDALGPQMFHMEGGYHGGETRRVHRVLRLVVADQVGGREDITGPVGIDLVHGERADMGGARTF